MNVTPNLSPLVQARLAHLSAQSQAAFVAEFERRAKSAGAAYGFWALCGFHYAYLRMWGWQVLYILTGGGFIIWLVVDLFRIPGMVRNFNQTLSLQVLNDLGPLLVTSTAAEQVAVAPPGPAIQAPPVAATPIERPLRNEPPKVSTNIQGATLREGAAKPSAGPGRSAPPVAAIVGLVALIGAGTLGAVFGGHDAAETKWTSCKQLTEKNDSEHVRAAGKACEEAIRADPISPSGEAAAELLKNRLRPKLDDLLRSEKEAVKNAAVEKATADEAQTKIAQAIARVASRLAYEGATARGDTIVLRSEECDELGSTVMGNVLREKIGKDDLIASGVVAFECQNPYGQVYKMTYRLQK